MVLPGLSILTIEQFSCTVEIHFKMDLTPTAVQGSKKNRLSSLSGTTRNCGGQVDSKATCPRDKCHKTTSNDPISCLYNCG